MLPLIQTGPAGPTPRGLPNLVLATDPSGSSSDTAALRALVQSDLPNMLNLFGSLPNCKVYPTYTSQTGLSAISTVDVYTVPARRRAILMQVTISQAVGATSSTFVTKLKIGSSYYTFATSGSIAASAGVTLYSGSNGTASANSYGYVAEAGEGFSITQTSSGAVWQALMMVIEFDNTSPLKTVKVLNPGSGQTALYSPSGSKNAMIMSPQQMLGNMVSSASAVNAYPLVGATAASSSSTVSPYYQHLSGTPFLMDSATLIIPLTAGVITNGIPRLGMSGILNGDTLVINCSVAVTGFVGVTVFEF